MSRYVSTASVLALCFLPISFGRQPAARAADPDTALYQAYATDESTADARWQPLKTLNGHFPFKVPPSLEAWETRADALRRRILVAGGLWPMPTKTPLNAVIHGKTERDGFTVEKVYFESVPGNFVTGLLFRPSDESTEQRPAVLCPHGHGGRLQDKGTEGVRREIAAGFERFEASGRFPALARCAQLARMGCVTFIYDMIGYGDNQQISYQVAHRQAKSRPHMEGTDRWGFYSPQAELRSQSILGLQIWNSIRALDFLAALPDVDPDRMAVTGNSGGGTQTLLLCAIDSRPVAAFPNGMVSTSMQGGCYCENASLLRVGTGNVELTALFAPEPLGMTAVDDWTRDMMSDGYPQLKRLYEMYGKPDQVMCTAFPHFPHNYNYVTRCLMYSFMNRHLQLGLSEPIVEEDYRLLSPDEYRVWTGGHEPPPGGDDFEAALLAEMAERSDAQLEQMRRDDFAGYHDAIRGAYRTIIGRDLPALSSVSFQQKSTASIGRTKIELGLIEHEEGDRIPAAWLHRSSVEQPSEVVLVLRGMRKANVFGANGAPIEAVDAELSEGRWVLAVDLFAAGENLTESADASLQRRVADSRQYCGFTYGYNPVRFARRAQDVLTAVIAISKRFPDLPVRVAASEGAGPLAAAARLIAGSEIDQLEVDTEGFRFANLDSVWDSQFVPGAVKFGDLPAMLAAQAPLPLRILGEATPLPAVVDAYRRTEASESLRWQ